MYRSGPLETINLTSPPDSTRPPPGGSVSMIAPLAISSSKRFSKITVVKPKGVSEERACSYVPPTTDGTTTREPGPTNVYQPPIPRAMARMMATFRLRRTRLLAFFFFSFAALISWVVSFTSILSSFSSSTAFFIFPRGFSLIGSIGRSRANFI